MSKDEREQLGNGQRPEWSDAKDRQKDTDATHTKKHGKSYFGYKLSVSVDHKHGFIRGVATSTASEHDGHHFDEVLNMNNTGKEVNADKAYPSAQRIKMLKVLGFKDGIQRKAKATSSRRARVCRHSPHGRQVRAHDWASQGLQGHDDDGRLLQPQALGLVS